LKDQTIERLKHLVSEKLDMNIRIEDIDPGAPLLGDGLNLDSLALVELISLVEDSFGIEFGERDLNMESFASLRNLAAVIAAQTPALV
jgi:acyl carrier protein